MAEEISDEVELHNVPTIIDEYANEKDDNVFGITNDNLSNNSESDINYFFRKMMKGLFILLKYAYPNICIVCCIIFYEFSLEGCFLEMEACVTLFDKEQIHKRILRSLAISALFFTIHGLLIFYKWVSGLLTYILYTFTFVFMIILRDSGTDLKYHGAYNRIVFIVFVLFFLLFFFTLKSIETTISKKYKKGIILLVSILIILLLLYIMIMQSLTRSCKYWNEGFKGVLIDNSKFCKIIKPNICYQSYLEGYLDLSYYSNDSCQIRKNDSREKFAKYLKSDVNKIGYPRAENYDYLNKGHYLYFQKNVLKDLVNIDDPNISQEIKDQIEVTIDFSKNKINGEAKVELKKQTKLADERKKIFEEKFADKVLTKNIFILFIDSVSRQHFRRKLPKTWQWLEKFYKPEPDVKEKSDSELFQFLKFHGVGTWTNVNMIPAMFGTAYDKSVKSTYYLKYFKDAGYITGSAGTMCSRELIDLDNSMRHFEWASYDHELYSFFCDPNFTPVDNPFPILNGPYSIRKKCLYGRSTAEWAVDYSKQFFEAYKDYPKLYRIDIIDQHEGTGEVVKYDDDLLHDFLVWFEENGYMKDTTIFVLSDHNFNMPGLYSLMELEDWKKELTLPHLSIILDKNMENFEEIKENLVYNENIMVNPYDVHSTMLSLFNRKISFTPKGHSLFHEKFSLEPKERSCKQMNIKEDWCRCSEEYN